MENAPVFSRLMEEYGNLDHSKPMAEGHEKAKKEPVDTEDTAAPEIGDAVLMSTEERNIGAVPLSIYQQYLKFAGGIIWAPAMLLLLIFFQAASGMSTWLLLCKSSLS